MKKIIPLFVLCLFLSCEKDDQIIVNDRNNDNNSQIKLEYVSSEAYKDNTEVHKVIKNFTLNKDKYLRSTIGNATYENIQAKSTYLPEYGVTIKEDHVAHIQAGEYESFTYQIVNTYIDDELHNLFLSKKKDGSYKAFITKYALTESQKIQIENGVMPTDLKDNFILIPIDNTGDFPDTASSPSDCNNEPPCQSYPCCVTIDGMSWIMTSGNSCIPYNSSNSIYNQTGPEGPCPPEFTATDGQDGGGSGNDNNTTDPNDSSTDNNDDTSTNNENTDSNNGNNSSGNGDGSSGDGNSSSGNGSGSGGGGTGGGSDPCGSDPNCPDDDPNNCSGAGAGGGGSTNPDDDTTNDPDDDEDECIPVDTGVNGFLTCDVTTPVIEICEEEDDCQEEDCNTSKEDLKKVFTNTSDSRLQEITDAINTHGQDFGIDTEEKLQHFLAQAGHESKNVVTGTEFDGLEENLNYRVNKLGIDYWTKRFNPYTSYTEPPTTLINPDKENPNDYASQTSSVFVDNEDFANFVYDDANRSAGYKLGNVNSGDGYKFRGRGIIQLTGRSNYSEFNTFYQNNYDNTINLINNPDLLATDVEIAVISALWYFENKVLNETNETLSVLNVTEKVNGGDNGINDRKAIFNECVENINCL